MDFQHVLVRVARLLEKFWAEHPLLIPIRTAVSRVEVFLGNVIHNRVTRNRLALLGAPVALDCSRRIINGGHLRRSVCLGAPSCLRGGTRSKSPYNPLRGSESPDSLGRAARRPPCEADEAHACAL